VFIRADNAPEPGESVQIVFWGTSSELELQAVVRWVGQREDGAEGFGAQLVDPPREYLELVHSIEHVDIARAKARNGPPRGAARVSVSLPVGVEFEALCDSGVLYDISATGARLEGTHLEPPFGRQLTLTFWLAEDAPPFEVVARAVRKTEAGGYAVQFEAIDPALKGALHALVARIDRMPESS